MKRIKAKIEEIKSCVEDLENQGIYIDLRPQEIEEMVDAPEEFDILPSDFVVIVCLKYKLFKTVLGSYIEH